MRSRANRTPSGSAAPWQLQDQTAADQATFSSHLWFLPMIRPCPGPCDVSSLSTACQILQAAQSCLRPEIFRDNDGAFPAFPFTHTHTHTHSFTSHLIPSSSYGRKNSHNCKREEPSSFPKEKAQEGKVPGTQIYFTFSASRGDLGAAGLAGGQHIPVSLEYIWDRAVLGSPALPGHQGSRNDKHGPGPGFGSLWEEGAFRQNLLPGSEC